VISRGRICTKFGIGCRLPDVITCAKFYIDRFWGFDSVRRGIKICPKPVAVNTEHCRYRADSDLVWKLNKKLISLKHTC